MNKTIENFVSEERNKGITSNVFFDFEYKEKVFYGNIQCNGFFESKYHYRGKIGPYLAVAIKKPLDKWLPIFTHETSHMDQWLENSPLWLTSEDFALLDNWLEGKEYHIKEVSEFIHKVILVEADCERRTIEKIKKHNLPIDTKYYAQRANAYLYYYQWLIAKRLWYKTEPYEVPEIIGFMPEEIKNDEEYLKPLSTGMMKLFNKCQQIKI